MLRRALSFLAATLSAALLPTTDARACGGCFVPPQSESTVVTAHRMALSISKTQTVLWDQIRYAGNPKDFSWVLPVLPGAKVELSHDEFFAALDVATQPIVVAPPPPPPANGGGAGCGSSSASSFSSGSAPNDPGVVIVHQEVVGPYEVVTLSATDPQALTAWLASHAYVIPTAIQPVIDGYVKERFDFIAMRLLPSASVGSMRPVRVVMPGANATLPLRMVAAGAGAKVGLLLYVIGEGRYETANFPNVAIDERLLVWDAAQSRSNYSEESARILSTSNGWLTEFAYPMNEARNAFRVGLRTTLPTLASAYAAASPFCGPQSSPFPDIDASPLAEAGDDATTMDASTDADAIPEAAAPDGSATACELDDLTVATRGMYAQDMWITRLRADLPTASLGADLALRAAKWQVKNDALYQASTDRGDGCSTAPGDTNDLYVPFAAAIAVAATLARRRRP